MSYKETGSPRSDNKFPVVVELSMDDIETIYNRSVEIRTALQTEKVEHIKAPTVEQFAADCIRCGLDTLTAKEWREQYPELHYSKAGCFGTFDGQDRSCQICEVKGACAG